MENCDDINENNLLETIRNSLKGIHTLFIEKQLTDNHFIKELEKILLNFSIISSIESNSELNTNVIFQLGTLNIFLPLFEIFYELQKNNKEEHIFELILKLIEVLFLKEYNWYLSQKNKFLYIISLFLERYNDFFFQNGKYFEYISNINFRNLKNFNDNTSLTEDYSKYILFNYKIFKKINKNIQNKFIEHLNSFFKETSIGIHVDFDNILMNFEQDSNSQIWKFSRCLIRGLIFNSEGPKKFLPLQYCLFKNNDNLFIEILSIYNELFSMFNLSDYNKLLNSLNYFLDSNLFNQVISLLKTNNITLKFKIIELLRNLTMNIVQKGEKNNEVVFTQRKNGKEVKITKEDCTEFLRLIKNKQGTKIEKEIELDKEEGEFILLLHNKKELFFDILKSLINSFLNLSLNKLEKEEYSYVDEIYCENNYKEIIDNILSSLTNLEKGKKNFYQQQINELKKKEIPKIFNYEKNNIRRQLIRSLRSLALIQQEKFKECIEDIYLKKLKECKVITLNILFNYCDSSKLKLLTKTLFYFISSFSLKHFSKVFIDNFDPIEDFIYDYIIYFNNDKFKLKDEYEENYKMYLEKNKIIKQILKLDSDGIYTLDSLLLVITKIIEDGKGKKYLDQIENYVYGEKGLTLVKSLINIVCYPIQESKSENFNDKFNEFEDKLLFICITASLVREENLIEMQKHFLNLFSLLIGILFIFLKNNNDFFKKAFIFIFRILYSFYTARKKYKKKHFILSIIMESNFLNHPISHINNKIIEYYEKKKNEALEKGENQIPNPSETIEEIAKNYNINNLNEYILNNREFINFIYTFQFTSDNVDETNINQLNDNDFEINNNESKYLLTDEKPDFKLFKKKINSQRIFQYIHVLLRKKEYLKVKKDLFSWNGFYSDLKTFINPNQQLKFKLSNHLTKDFSLQIMKPILDFDNYYPYFEKYNIKNIFRDDFDKVYKINLKIDKNEKFEDYFQEDITINEFDEIKLFNCYVIKKIIKIYSILLFSLISKIIIIFHVKKEEDINSLFNYGKSNKEYITKFNVSDIKFIIKKKINYKEVGIEIFHKNNKTYFIEFNDEKSRNDFLNLFLELKLNKSENFIEIKNILINTYYKNQKYYSLNSLINNWIKRKISSFEFLMWLNFYGNRSYQDLFQYPIFPWIISDYSIIKNTNYNLNDLPLRDLSKPMGMLEINNKGKERKNKYLTEFYQSFNIEKGKKYNLDEDYLNNNNIEIDKIPYIYSSHYSNIAYVCHYNIRIFPYSFSSIHIQGNNFDVGDRIFNNLEYSFLNCTSDKMDVRELIPEFYCFPDFLTNINNLNLGQFQHNNNNIKNEIIQLFQQIEKKNEEESILVNNVLVPFWCENDKFKFVTKLREYLEKNENLNSWIDLIFGINESGLGAVENNNIFMPCCYIDSIIERKKKNNEEDKIYLSYLDTLFQLGVNPVQILKDKCPKRETIKNKFNSNVVKGGLFKENYEILFIKIYDNYLLCINSNLELYKFLIDNEKNINNGNMILKIEKEKYSKDLIQIINNDLFTLTILLTKEKDKIDIISLNNYSLFFNNYLFLRDLDNSIITYMIADEDNNLLYCGTQKGTIFIFELIKLNEKEIKLEAIHILKNHTKKILFIHFNNILNLFADCSEDGLVNIYRIPKGELIRIIYLEHYIFNYIYLSECPLSCLCFFSEKENEFITFSINGIFLKKEKEVKDIISIPLIVSDVYFCNYLIYLKKENNGIYLNIKNLPYLEQIQKIMISEKINENKFKIIYDKEDKFIYICEESKILIKMNCFSILNK